VDAIVAFLGEASTNEHLRDDDALLQQYGTCANVLVSYTVFDHGADTVFQRVNYATHPIDVKAPTPQWVTHLGQIKKLLDKQQIHSRLLCYDIGKLYLAVKAAHGKWKKEDPSQPPLNAYWAKKGLAVGQRMAQMYAQYAELLDQCPYAIRLPISVTKMKVTSEERKDMWVCAFQKYETQNHKPWAR